MAGHNKWSKIKHRKAAVEKKKTKVWTKCSRALMVAARQGGPNPDANVALRYAIDEARYANMPKETIQRAIDKGAGSATGADFEAITYEGYGPGGVAVIVDALTDNRTRTATDMRLIFGTHGGNLGASGCVAFLFSTKGQILVPASGIDEDRLIELALEAGADDVIPPEPDQDEPGFFEVLTPPASLMQIKETLNRAGIAIEQAEITKIPETTVEAPADQVQAVLDLLDALEDNDDVQKVYSNLRLAQ